MRHLASETYVSPSRPGLQEYAGHAALGDYAAHANWARNNAPPPDIAAGATWDNWRPTPVRVGDRPYPMLRVGMNKKNIDGSNPPVAMIAGLGEGHTLLKPPENLDLEAISEQDALDVVQSAVFRTMGSTMPGAVKFWIYDGHFKGVFKEFGDLTGVRSTATGEPLVEHIPSSGLEKALGRIMDLQGRLNSGEVKQAGTLENPWQVLVMLGDADLSNTGRDYLNRLIKSGVGWGMFLGVGVGGLTAKPPLLLHGPPLRFRPDPPPPKPLVKKTCAQIVEAMKRGPVKVPPVHEYYMNAVAAETASTAEYIEGDIGVGLDGSRVTVRFGDDTPHGLLEGGSGSGKTYDLRALICSLARYSPAELNLIIVDGKYAGMAVFDSAEEDGDPAFLPQATRLGLNVTDPEDWLAILQDLDKELDRRKTLMGDYRSIANFSALRAKLASKNEELPRILLIWDEVQELFASSVGDEAIAIINRLTTMGRDLGIHLLLATVQMDKMRQNNAEIQSSGLLTKFLLRMATRSATSVLDRTTHKNFMPLIPKHAVAVNTNGGEYTDGNMIARVPDAGVEFVKLVKTAAWKRWGGKEGTAKRPVVLDGRHVPSVKDAPSFRQLRPSNDQWPVGFIAQKPGASAETVKFQFSRTPGRNIAIVGSETREIGQVFQSMTETIPTQYHPGQVKFSIVCRNADLAGAARKAEAQLKTLGHAVSSYTDKTASLLFDEVAEGIKLATDRGNRQDHYLLVYGDGPDSGSFATILKEGSERGTHVIASWANLDRVRRSMGGFGDLADVAEGYVLLNVTSDEVQRITGSFKHSWGKSKRPGRALVGDARSGEPAVVAKLYA